MCPNESKKDGIDSERANIEKKGYLLQEGQWDICHVMLWLTRAQQARTEKDGCRNKSKTFLWGIRETLFQEESCALANQSTSSSRTSFKAHWQAATKHDQIIASVCSSFSVIWWSSGWPPKVPTPWAKYVDMMRSHHATILVWKLLFSLTRRDSYK